MIWCRVTQVQGLKIAQSVCAFSTSRTAFASAPETVKMWIDGKRVESTPTYWIDHTNPATGEVIGKVPQCSQAELQKAVDSAKRAFETWRLTSPILRTQCMYDFRDLIKRDTRRIAECITTEHGKTIGEAESEIKRGLQVVEEACGATSHLMGEILPGLSRDLDTTSIRVPLGVCGGITPFNFPAMCFLWMVPMALVAGNTFVIKPSEQDPGAALIFAELAKEAGIPDGCLNVIHGQHDTVNFICDHPDIKAVSFVGGNRAGEHIYARASKSMKRVQCNMGAKCLSVVMPDAHKKGLFRQLTSGAYGCSGQRCLALTTAIMVGEAKEWIPEIVEDAKRYKVGPGCRSDTDFGPMISKQARTRCLELIESARKDGCRILLDGTKYVAEGYENGFFVGATVIEGVTENMRCYKEEIFGPVLLIMCVDTLDDAMAIINRNPYGNGASIFTTSGPNARKFLGYAEPGLIGINIPVPIPLSMFSFTGNKKSFAGDYNYCGKMGIHFYTQWKTITWLWRQEIAGHNTYSENFKMAHT